MNEPPTPSAYAMLLRPSRGTTHARAADTIVVMTPQRPAKRSIFLSYSRANAETARSLATDLEKLGHSVWLDQRLTGGQKWWDEILEQIRACDVFVFALTPSSELSVACNREKDYATALRKPILPIQLADGISASVLTTDLATTQIIDYRHPDLATGLGLAKSINALPPAPPLPQPLPAAPSLPISPLNGIADRLSLNEPLTDDEQQSILIALQRAHRDAKTQSDAHTLVTRLRRRRELLSTVATDLDHLVEKRQGPSWFPKIAISLFVTLGGALLAVYLVDPRSGTVESVSTTPGPDPWSDVPRELRGAVGDSDTRASLDFDGDGALEQCRIVTGSPSYFLCSSSVRVFYGEIDQPGLPNWPRNWIDWDGDGMFDWCRIIGDDLGEKSLRCNFGDGTTMSQSFTSAPFDVGYGFSYPPRKPSFQRIDGVMNYCRSVGPQDTRSYPCRPAAGRGLGPDS